MNTPTYASLTCPPCPKCGEIVDANFVFFIFGKRTAICYSCGFRVPTVFTFHPKGRVRLHKHFACRHCGEEFNIEPYLLWLSERNYIFCPSCGAVYKIKLPVRRILKGILWTFGGLIIVAGVGFAVSTHFCPDLPWWARLAIGTGGFFAGGYIVALGEWVGENI